MDKKVNTVIKETKDNIVRVINESQLPIGVIDLIIDNIVYEVKNSLNIIIEKEKTEYNQMLDLQAQQVEWVPEETE